MSKLLKGISLPILTLMIILFTFSVVSCGSDEEVKKIGQEQSVELSAQSISLDIGEQYNVNATFAPDVKPTRTYRWVSSNPDIVGIKISDVYSATLIAKNDGSSTIIFSSSDGELKASFDVTVKEAEEIYVDDGITKILAIGNSFSEDALENYLYQLASSKNVKIVIGNLYIGGSSLEQHWSNATDNKAAYDYRKIAQNGTKTNTPSTSIETAVLDEDWDYISFQQVSNNSGQYETYVSPLPKLVEYVKKQTTNPEAKYILHQTWAYAQNSTHSAFPNYQSNQVIMYNAIVKAVRKAEEAFKMDLVIPAGTAIQNGRKTLIGDNFNRDGYHLDLGIGRYTAASTWFEAITGINVIGNPYKPAALSDLEAEIAQHAAHAAVVNPDEVTPLPDYDAVEAGPLKAPLYINFGQNDAPKWNKIGHLEGSTVPSLKDENDDYTNISITITQRFNGMNSNGEKETTTAFNMPASVSGQSYFGNSKGVWDKLEIRQSQFKLSGLNKNGTFNLCFFGSRGGVNDNRETKFIVSGANSKTVNLNTTKNQTNIVCADNIKPDTNGDIIVTVTAGDNNDNEYGFYFLGAMRLTKGE